MKKYAIIGTSCSGKTTTVYNVVGELRKQGLHIEGIISSDRHYTFDAKKLDFMPEAQSYVILQQAFLESNLSTRDDIQILLSDRSPLDFFAYFEYCLKDDNEPYYQSMKQMVWSWAKTYDAIFYLEPLPYVSDNKRPDDEFRLGVDKIIKSYLPNLPNLINVNNGDRINEIIRVIKEQNS